MRFLVFLLALLPPSVVAADTLDIYWIDVEGGAELPPHDDRQPATNAATRICAGSAVAP